MAENDHVEKYLADTAAIAGRIDRAAVRRMVDILVDVRRCGGRLFILGVGGGAGLRAVGAWVGEASLRPPGSPTQCPYPLLNPS